MAKQKETDLPLFAPLYAFAPPPILTEAEEQAAKLEGLAGYYPDEHSIRDAALATAAELRKAGQHRVPAGSKAHGHLTKLLPKIDPHSTAHKLLRAHLPKGDA